MKSIRLIFAAVAACLSLGSAHAALTPFQLFTGNVGSIQRRLGLDDAGWHDLGQRPGRGHRDCGLPVHLDVQQRQP